LRLEPEGGEGHEDIAYSTHLRRFFLLIEAEKHPDGTYKAVIEAASAYAQTWMVSKYDAENPKALRELVVGGTKLMPFPQPLMEAAFNASNELYAELSVKSPKFKKIYENWRPFRNEEILWFRVCENSFDNFMSRMSAADKL
jgi:TRAP-type mannitol/chloroaromatic compound transport system substrate-binding protein